MATVIDNGKQYTEGYKAGRKTYREALKRILDELDRMDDNDLTNAEKRIKDIAEEMI